MGRLVSRAAVGLQQGRERGAAAIEYVGIVIAAAFLVSALVATVPSAREWMVCTAKQVNAPIVGGSNTGGCAVGGNSAGSVDNNVEERPKPPCRVSSSEYVSKYYASILVVDFGYETAERTEVLSDGTVKVTIIDKGKLGAGKGIKGTGKFSALQARAGIAA